MARFLEDVAPTLGRLSRVKIGFPAPQEADPIVIQSDPEFDLRAGSAPVDPSAPASAIGGKQDGRIYNRGGYPAAVTAAIIGRPYAGTHSLGNWQSDNAIDIGVKTGTPILATQDGTIQKVYAKTLDPKSRFSGYQVTLKTKDNQWFYTHLSRVPKGLKPGMKVKKGQVIGYGGAANGVDHLHLGVQFGNPLELLGLK